MQLHAFEQTVFHRHRKILYFMCFYLTINIVAVLGRMQHKFFLSDCNYGHDNYEYFADVLGRVVVPEEPRCRVYEDGLNLTAANASALHVVSNLTTVIQQCTFSLNSLW